MPVCPLNLITVFARIELQDRIRRSGSEPNENDQRDVERMRQVIISQFSILESLNSGTSHPGFVAADSNEFGDASIFDDIDNEDPSLDLNTSNERVNAAIHEDIGDAAAKGLASEVVPPEKKNIPLPSNSITTQNNTCQIELDLRLDQAAKILSGLRDLIAEKSFQFSDVIRVAPRKGVRTRARSAIAKLNNLIAYHCRVYNRCHAAMVKLGANDATLTKFRVLTLQDIRSSSALLKPNEPGSSTNHRLSWIWQSGRTVDDRNTLGINECTFFEHSKYMRYNNFAYQTVNRVHWLRARAQRERWKEELMLVKKEMDWTVRYYIHHARVWRERKDVADNMGDIGAAAYAARKDAMWLEMAAHAAADFQAVNPLYKYPN